MKLSQEDYLRVRAIHFAYGSMTEKTEEFTVLFRQGHELRLRGELTAAHVDATSTLMTEIETIEACLYAMLYPNRGKRVKTERNEAIKAAIAGGESGRKVAQQYGITYQRAYQIAGGVPTKDLSERNLAIGIAYERGDDVRDIAAEHGLTVGSVRIIVHRLGLHRKKRISPKAQAVLDDYAADVPIREIMEKSGWTNRSIHTYCFNHGSRRPNRKPRTKKGE